MLNCTYEEQLRRRLLSPFLPSFVLSKPSPPKDNLNKYANEEWAFSAPLFILLGSHCLILNIWQWSFQAQDGF